MKVIIINWIPWVSQVGRFNYLRRDSLCVVSALNMIIAIVVLMELALVKNIRVLQHINYDSVLQGKPSVNIVRKSAPEKFLEFTTNTST